MKWIETVPKLALAACLLLVGCGPKPARSTADPDLVAAMNRGVSLMGQYQYDEAVKAFEQALRAGPNLPEVRVNLAIARFNRGMKEQRDLETSGELLDAVLKEDPNHLRALYFKAIILQHVGQTEAAVPLLQKIAAQRPDDGAVRYLLGMCKQRLGQSAETELQRAIELRPYLASAYYRLWQSLQAAGETNKAAPYLEKFKQLRESPLSETIELPQYNQMGDLALVQPLAGRAQPPLTPSTITAEAPARIASFAASPNPTTPPKPLDAGFGGAVAGDLNRDGRLDVILTRPIPEGQNQLLVLQGDGAGGFTDVTEASGLAQVIGPLALALGDYDNDETLDLLVGTLKGGQLFRGRGDGSFTNVTAAGGLAASTGPASCVLFLDADHDGDLDLFIAGTAPTGNQLWNNNADGSFTNIAARAEILTPEATTVAVLPGDLDGDRDTDLVLLQQGQPGKILLNDLLGRFRAVDAGITFRGDRGGALEDLNGDGQLDLLVLGDAASGLQLYLGDGRGRFRIDPAFAPVARTITAETTLRAIRVIDIDLDGDLDIVGFAEDGHLLLNDGTGRFAVQRRVWRTPAGSWLVGAELLDLTGDLVPDLLRIDTGAQAQTSLARTRLTPPSTAFAIAPTGMRGRDKRTRSPASGFGVALTVRAGIQEQRRVYTGLAGGVNQSAAPISFGLAGARQADYVHLLWPDGVMQVEVALAAGQTQTIAELQRKISSCPVLFTWNGSRFEFVTDFAGVGGLGYFVAPGEYATPQPLEHIKVEPNQWQPRDGVYELRITEPMEETAYLDQLELRVIDHPAGWVVHPDERLAISGQPPTHELLAVPAPIFPKRALGPAGQDCTTRLLRVDRDYAYEPVLDRRFFGFAEPHTLELDFGRLPDAVNPSSRLFLFLHGFLEYPYSQTVYAASQARVTWQPIRVEAQAPDGSWRIVLDDAGTFGGMARMMTIDLTGRLPSAECRLRLSSNLEMYYDQAFLGCPAEASRVRTHRLAVSKAELRRVGFAREYSPDGKLPLIYDYDLRDATAPFHVLSGAYTRYGAVDELLREADDRFVLVGPGDEVAVTFDASSLPALSPGTTRSLVLVSHAWCKDMDLYTATPQTLEPMPFRGMSRYPYPPEERPRDNPAQQRDRDLYQTRIVQ